jgi:hypothetical protein
MRKRRHFSVMLAFASMLSATRVFGSIDYLATYVPYGMFYQGTPILLEAEVWFVNNITIPPFGWWSTEAGGTVDLYLDSSGTGGQFLGGTSVYHDGSAIVHFDCYYTCPVDVSEVTHDFIFVINDILGGYTWDTATRTFYPPGSPHSFVTVDGHTTLGYSTPYDILSLTLPPENTTPLTVRFKATDPDANLASMLPAIRDPAGVLFNDTEEPTMVSGSNCEVSRPLIFNKSGTWTLSGYVLDADGQTGLHEPLYVTVTEQATVASPTVSVTLSGTNDSLTLNDSITVSSAASSGSETLNIHTFKWRGGVSTPMDLAGLPWVSETMQPTVWSNRIPTAPNSPSGGSNSSIQAVFHPPRRGWYEFQGEAKSPHSWRASSTGQSVFFNNVFPGITVSAPQTVRAGVPFNVTITATQSVYVQGYTGLRIKEWRGPESGVDTLEWGAWVQLNNGTAPQSSATWTSQSIAGHAGKIIYNVSSWNGDATGDWMSHDINTLPSFVILVRESQPSVAVQILDSGGAPMTTGTDGKVHLALDSNYTIQVSGSDSMGELTSLKTDIYDPQGILVSSTQTTVSGTTAVSSRAFAANEIGGWRVKATARNGDNFSSIINFPLVVESEIPPPTTPQGLSAHGITDTFFTLAWEPSSSDTGVLDYAVSMGGTAAGGTNKTYKLITGLAAGSVYQMRVRARDTNGLWSAWSTPLAVTTSTIALNPTLDTDGDGVPDIVEHELGTSHTGTGTNPDNALQVKFLTPPE